jgi:cyclopropane-fatty-acyl-phospholipid synthase
VTNTYKNHVQQILQNAGVGLNTSEPCHLTVHNEQFYQRAIHGGQMEIMESYIEGWWDSDDLAEAMTRVMLSNVSIKPGFGRFFIALQDIISNRQSKKLSREVGAEHYDFPVEIYKPMLGERLIYSCSYLAHTKDIDVGQLHKLEVMCEPGKADIHSGMKVLDIGCGWGEVGKFLGERGVDYTGITISQGQYDYAVKLCAHLPNVRFLMQDYRDHVGMYDRIVSIGMFEHVGRHNHREFFEKCVSLVKDDGRLFLHSIFNPKPKHNHPYLEKYIFKGGDLPALSQIEKATDGLLKVWDYHEFGRYYDLTLVEWNRRFTAFVDGLSREERVRIFGKTFPKYWGDISAEERATRAIRMWDMYQLSCAAGFRTGFVQLFQLTMTKESMFIPNYEVSR